MIRCALLAATLAACVEPPEPEREELAGPCAAAVTEVPIEDSPHVSREVEIEWTSNPPTSGPHFATWAQWEKSYADLHRGFYLHNAEHGGVVFLHRCTDCPDTVAQLAQVIAALPDDPTCPPLDEEHPELYARTRTLVVADPLLRAETPIAAIAWGTMYTASCVDDVTLSAFARDHAGRSSENTCAQGEPHDGVALP
jgi:hypothetical protein